MESDKTACYLVWGGGGQYHKTVPFDSLINVPTFNSAAGTCHYLAREAVVARANSLYHQEVVQVLGQQREPNVQEYLAEENVNTSDKLEPLSLEPDLLVTGTEEAKAHQDPLIHQVKALTIDF